MEFILPELDENGDLNVLIDHSTFRVDGLSTFPIEVKFTSLMSKLALIVCYLDYYPIDYHCSVVDNDVLVMEEYGKKSKILVAMYMKEFRKNFNKVLKLVTKYNEIKIDFKIHSRNVWKRVYTSYANKSSGVKPCVPIQEILQCEVKLFKFIFTDETFGLEF